MSMALAKHRWRFFRSGGFDQVRLETVADLKALDQLDLKLWASLACPVKGIEFDERTLAYIDSDGDGRIRAPEILSAVRWTLAHLAQPEVLFSTQALPLSAIDTQSEAGQQLLKSAQHLLRNLGRADATALSVADTEDLAKIFPPSQPNGDGLVPAALTSDERLQALIQDIIAIYGADTDRSGEPAVSEEKITHFFDAAEALQAWRERLRLEGAQLAPLGENSEAAVATYQAVAAKVEDFFMRTQFAAYDARAALLMNGSETELSQLSAQALHVSNEEALRMPLAQISADRTLPLLRGINPAWATAMKAFREQLVKPLLGEREELGFSEWQDLQNRLAAHLAWLAEKPSSTLDAVEPARLQDYLAHDAREALLALVTLDRSVEAEANSILEADKLVRLQRFLVPLLNNFVALRDFYTGDKGVFQAGTLYLDGRSFDLCVEVTDAARHAQLAGLSRTYLAYCDCTRQGSSVKKTIVAAVTAGSAGNLMAGRNGVFYDRKGQDWDATISRIVENPISLREAFWSPYRRIGRLVSEQAQKMAASKEQAVNDKMAGKVGDVAAQVGAPPLAPGSAAVAPFDIGKFVGIFAAIGLALGAIGTALAAMVAGLVSLQWWQIPLVVLAVLLLISGPAMILAWFKLRARNLGPILDANGWAVNTQAKINIPFGSALTHLACLPAGAERSFSDPYASRQQRLLWWGVALLLIIALAWGWQQAWFSPLAVPAASQS